MKWSNGDRNSNLWLDEYLSKIKPYLRNIIIDLQSSDTEQKSVVHSTSNNIKFTSYNDANKVANELSESLPSRYQGNLEKSMRGIDVIFY